MEIWELLGNFQNPPGFLTGTSSARVKSDIQEQHNEEHHSSNSGLTGFGKNAF